MLMVLAMIMLSGDLGDNIGDGVVDDDVERLGGDHLGDVDDLGDARVDDHADHAIYIGGVGDKVGVLSDAHVDDGDAGYGHIDDGDDDGVQ